MSTIDRRSVDDLKEAGDGRPAPDNVAALHQRAFAEFGTDSLWNRRPSEYPTIGQSHAIPCDVGARTQVPLRALAITHIDWHGPAHVECRRLAPSAGVAVATAAAPR